MEKKYWKGLEELQSTKEHTAITQNEFKEDLPLVEMFDDKFGSNNTGRRDFLKMMGFSVAAATMAASCELPVRKAIPYLIKPEEVVPGVANWYASSYSEGGEYCSIMVKSREGRPIKIEGNSNSSITKGGTSARVQASILSLYDMGRSRFPSISGTQVKWDAIDAEIKNHLTQGPIAILTGTIISPSTKAVIKQFNDRYPDTKHITYDANSNSAMLMANEASFGKKMIPGYRFDLANVIVSFGADFLGSWISPIEYTKQYVVGRKLDNGKMEMSKHFQIESTLTLTGANADDRATIHPSEEGLAVAGLYSLLTGASCSLPCAGHLKEAAAALLAAKGTGLVVSGSNDINIQIVVNHINALLGNYGNTIDLGTANNQRQGIDGNMTQLIDDMLAGKYSSVLIAGCNPSFDYPTSKFNEGLKKVACSISFNDRNDETTTNCKYHTPDSHYLESWNDAEPKTGYYSITQPVIAPLFKTRQFQDSLLIWSDNTSDYYTFLENNFTKNVIGGGKDDWESAVKNGVYEKPATASLGASPASDVAAALASLASNYSGKNDVRVITYEKVAMGNGKYANNPWLQEMPDPITKTTWDNYACISYDYAMELNLLDNNGSLFSDHKPLWDATKSKVINIKVGNTSIKLPILVQPGMAHKTVAIALGYGRTGAGKVGNNVGQNAYPLMTLLNGNWTGNSIATITATTEVFQLAQTQTHHSYEGRRIIKETTLEKFKKNPKEVNEDRDEIKAMMTTLYGNDKRYGEHEYKGHKWHMSIDLNSCIGCGNCTIACQSENNVSVVGKEHVVRAHEMHWIRIDRYYSIGDGKGGFNTMEKNINQKPDFDNVQVVFQPMLCQHCANAPCENVCPVNATNHSSEGLNQMAYNRCIGTRYCANNCPYKVRRFNWLDWNGADSFDDNLMADPGDMVNDLTRMVLNPDVTVRARGVIEKCSFCVQRIQEGKLEAKKNNMMLQDGMVKTACQSSCPADAIVFGDINNKESAVRKIYDAEDERRLYFVIEEIHTQSSIGYLAKVRNSNTTGTWLESKGEAHHEASHEGAHEEKHS
jgi:MoCo/4Fe-4S cofactor protein with predicted Tat translocation signal